MPGLIEKIKEWNQHRDPWNRIYFSFMTVTNPHTLVPDIFGAGVFEEDFQRIYDVWPTDSPDDLSSLEHMKGIQKQIEHKPRNVDHINDLKTYLTEIDRRRDTNWKELFPWLDKDWS
jgi:hypothetical protein